MVHSRAHTDTDTHTHAHMSIVTTLLEQTTNSNNKSLPP